MTPNASIHLAVRSTSELRLVCGAWNDGINWTTVPSAVTCPECACLARAPRTEGRLELGDRPPIATIPSPQEGTEINILTPFVAKFSEGTSLTPVERREVLHIAQGFAMKDSAAVLGISVETIRARRKRIYKKVRVSGSGELICTLLGLSLGMLARGERIEPEPVAPTEPQESLRDARRGLRAR